MKGRVKYYNEQKGFGFIIGEDENDYFFHNSSINSLEMVSVGDIVSFSPSENNKGKKAVDVRFVQSAPRRVSPSFIEIGGERIKISNIKDYSIMTLEKAYYRCYGYPLAPYAKEPTKPCLCITTYQDDFYYIKSSPSFDPFEKCRELDSLMLYK